MIAKYCPRGGFWAVRTTTGSSKLWKEIQGFKSFFKESTHWHIGEGTNIAALNQPWYEGWTTKRITNNRDRNVKVSQLYDHTTQQWRKEDIINLLGSDALEAILQLAPRPKTQPLILDKLIWTQGKKGCYTTKEGYQILHKQTMRQVGYSAVQRDMWKKIWSWKEILPRVRTFMWRAVHEGLPTQEAMHRRIRSISRTCQICGVENEFTVHTIFFCSEARATWCASQFPILVERLPLNFTVAKA